MPAELVTTLNTAINEAVKALAASGQLAKIGVEPVTETPKQFDDFGRDYLARGSELLKSAKFEPM
jgi:tripartite-type tricarboxylate transporter receptor subunit TctC